jgi:putative membrane protein
LDENSLSKEETMRSVRAFEILTLAIPCAFFACGGDRDHQAESPSNTSSYEAAPAETSPPATTQDPMTPASRPADEMTAAPETQGAAPQQVEQASSLSDEQFAAVTDAANTAEVDAAKYVLGKTKNARVRKFAQMMVDHHGKAKDNQEKLLSKLGMSPAESQKLRQLSTSASDTDRTLKAAPDDMLDKIYIDLQVADHQMVLETLDRDIIPNVDNAEFKKSLQDFRPKVEAHLREALEIQKVLLSASQKKSGTGSGSESKNSSGTPSGTSSGSDGTRGTSGTGTSGGTTSPSNQNTK